MALTLQGRRQRGSVLRTQRPDRYRSNRTQGLLFRHGTKIACSNDATDWRFTIDAARQVVDLRGTLGFGPCGWTLVC